ncbi:MAG: hypothetical protein NVS3B25_35340 [Hymenobacter sp.]
MSKQPGAGRPLALIDWKKVDRLLEAQCTATSIAARLGICVDTLYNRCKTDNKVDFSAYCQQKKESGEALLREQQFALAMKGNLGMLVWLGKQHLGQKEKAETETNSTIKVLTTEVLTRSAGVPLALDEKSEDDD